MGDKYANNLSENVLAGSKGTIVFVYDDPRLAYKVEFFDDVLHPDVKEFLNKSVVLK